MISAGLISIEIVFTVAHARTVIAASSHLIHQAPTNRPSQLSCLIFTISSPHLTKRSLADRQHLPHHNRKLTQHRGTRPAVHGTRAFSPPVLALFLAGSCTLRAWVSPLTGWHAGPATGMAILLPKIASRQQGLYPVAADKTARWVTKVLVVS